MKRIACSNITRVLAFILQEVFIVIALANAYFMYNDNIGETDVKEAVTTTSFYETDTFINEFSNDIKNALYFIECANDLELDGKLDISKKVVKLSDFLNEDIALAYDKIKDYIDNEYYLIGDLINWVNTGISYIPIYYLIQGAYDFSIESQRVYYYENESYYQLEDRKQGSKYILDGSSIEIEGNVSSADADINDTPFKLYESDLYNTMVVKEDYASIDQNMLWQYCNVTDIEESNTVREVMETSLKTFEEEYNYYINYNEQFRDKSYKGFKVYITDSKGNVIVNNAVNDGQSYEDTFFTDDKLISIAYDFKSDEYKQHNANPDFSSRIYSVLSEQKNSTDNEYFIAAGISSDLFNYSLNSSYLEESIKYEKTKEYINRIILSLAAALMLFLYLVIFSGKKYDSDEIELNSFDEIKTEIAALMVIIPAVLLIMIVNKLNYRQSVSLIVAAFFETVLFTWGFNSLIKRFKSRQFFRNSLFYALIRWVKQLWIYRKSTTKTIVGYGAYALLSAFLLMETFRYKMLLAFLVWAVVTLQVGVLQLKSAVARQKVMYGIDKITSGELDYKIDCDSLSGDSKKLAVAVNNIGEGLHNAVDASMRNERLKTDLITNVSHDIKTPLTSIINYVDLIKRENIDNEKINGYIEILDSKSQRLKHLTEDLVEASKISSGNITLEMTKINLVELINQTEGEFGEKFEEKSLNIVKTIPDEMVIIEADGRRIWRVIENLYNNVAKYAMPNTRVYIDLVIVEDKAQFSIKNISENALNINADELTERFIRGDVSRSTEGSGLGLSIAKNLTRLQKGEFEIYLDGDLFKVTITFPLVKENINDEGTDVD